MKKRKKGWMKRLAVTLIVSLILGLAPTPVWAEAAEQVRNAIASGWTAMIHSMAQQQEAWEDDPDRTETPAFYTFQGDQILEERPDIGEERTGGGGAYLKMEETDPAFPAAEGAMTLAWTDTLQDWIDGQAGEPVDPPAGYTVRIELKEIKSGKIYTLLDSHENSPGRNEFVWDGKDASGNDIPDGFYYWILKADSPTVTFRLSPKEEGGEPVLVEKQAPPYAAEAQRVVLDRTAPEIVGVHPLGDGLAVEARDLVGGLKQMFVQGAAETVQSWTTAPLRVALAVKPGEASELHITMEDVAGNAAEETLPLYPLLPGTGMEDHVPNAEAVVADRNMRINLTTGNGVQTFEGFTQQGPGVDLEIFFTYNHQNRLRGPLGTAGASTWIPGSTSGPTATSPGKGSTGRCTGSSRKATAMSRTSTGRSSTTRI